MGTWTSNDNIRMKHRERQRRLQKQRDEAFRAQHNQDGGFMNLTRDDGTAKHTYVVHLSTRATVFSETDRISVLADIDNGSSYACDNLQNFHKFQFIEGSESIFFGDFFLGVGGSASSSHTVHSLKKDRAQNTKHRGAE
ncbi:hypothetical protein PROFUN_03613 [Planoprotostelium fungivorum]|uniref:Uncharacterized protein n=1 Tax=Planoprotostelium fungivorum TaxID=1890364 RepID=A0A2P6MSK4_9EUKA|nr:hypothetical protein PROFUN_03613 [Planoprotostelium fungivorum]